MDWIHHKVRVDGRILSSAAYVAFGITAEGYKDILCITVGTNRINKFWRGMLNDLKNCGVKDVFFFCVDGFPGFKEAIQAVYPHAEIQSCVSNWEDVSSFFQFFDDIRRIMYTTNIIEGLNR